jgi:hypothetical protein
LNASIKQKADEYAKLEEVLNTQSNGFYKKAQDCETNYTILTSSYKQCQADLD